MGDDELVITTHAPQVLGAGVRLRAGAVVECVGSNVIGPVYRVVDELGSPIAVREYFPSALAMRIDGEVRPQALREAGFEAGRKRFEEDGEELAALDHPGLLRVQQVWSENGTSYQAMPWYEGRLLGDVVRAASVPPSQALLCDWLRAMADALTPVHRERGLHGHLSPWQVMRLDSGRLMLMEFSRARRFLARDPRDIDRDPYAALECGGDARFGPMGPWTDIYALAAIAHFALRGRPPQTPMRRAEDDTQEALSDCLAGDYDPVLLHGIDCGLAVRPRSRPRDLPAFLARAGLHERRSRVRSSGESLLLNLHLAEPPVAWPAEVMAEPTVAYPSTTAATPPSASLDPLAAMTARPPVAAPAEERAAVLAEAVSPQDEALPDDGPGPWHGGTQPFMRGAPAAPSAGRGRAWLAGFGALAAFVAGVLILLDDSGADLPPMKLDRPVSSSNRPATDAAPADTPPVPTASSASAVQAAASSPIPEPMEPTAAGPLASPHAPAPEATAAAQAAAESAASAASTSPSAGIEASSPSAARTNTSTNANASPKPNRAPTERPAPSPTAEPTAQPSTAAQSEGEAPTSPCPDLLARQYIGRPLSEADRQQLSALCR